MSGEPDTGRSAIDVLRSELAKARRAADLVHEHDLRVPCPALDRCESEFEAFLAHEEAANLDPGRSVFRERPLLSSPKIADPIADRDPRGEDPRREHSADRDSPSL